MTPWGAGYVTDIAYIVGYYRNQSPSMLSLACLLNNVPGIDPASDRPLSYLELGCGLGYGAMVQASCNPSWQVTAVDFNPAHIAAARELAREARIANIQFLEADLASLAEDPQSAAIPEADVVSMHGLWSWVPSAVRGGILRLFRAKVRPGGIVHVSYNALPAWQDAIGMQRMLFEAGRRLATRSDRQAQAGLNFVQALLGAEAVQLKSSPFATGLLERVTDAPVEYLAHEYMNQSWNPCFHMDVVADFADAKLEWVGPVAPLESFRQLTLTEAQRALLDRFDEPVMWELIKDTCLARGLRNDVFVRGARRLTNAERNEALGDITLALTRLPEHIEYEGPVPAGKATMETRFYGPIVAALGERPRRVRDLLAMPDVVGRRDNPAELLGLMVGTEQALPVMPRPAADDEPGTRLNRVAARRFANPQTPSSGVALASTRMGAALATPVIDLAVFGKLDAAPGRQDLDAWAAELSPDPDEERRQKMREGLGRILEERVPVWRRWGVLD
jgi:SAM-dependent methyltransferase